MINNKISHDGHSGTEGESDGGLVDVLRDSVGVRVEVAFGVGVRVDDSLGEGVDAGLDVKVGVGVGD